MMSGPFRIVKVGGSLLTWPPLKAVLNPWLARQTGTNVLIAGGGFLADSIRRFDRRLQFGVEEAHWLCVGAMSHTAQLLAHGLDHCPVHTTASRLSTATARVVVFDCEHFLKADEPRLEGTRLPHNWSVSSDSIAARVAEALQAPELVLLKSCRPPQPATRREAVSVGYVDDFFAQAAHNLPRVKCVNLRDVTGPETLLTET
jgi:aspartokinase-like uncharacterized kinase